MAKSISAGIYEMFFERLIESSQVDPQTVEALRKLQTLGKLASKSSVTRLVQEMEKRHAENTEPAR
ncbi:MAG: hypothetical protein ACYCZF_16970 [Anaerolineae bacterium]